MLTNYPYEKKALAIHKVSQERNRAASDFDGQLEHPDNL
jgi:hypothetical protein